MMKWTVKEVAQAKGFNNANELGERAGIPLTSMYRLWNGSAKMVGTDTLERLCKTLQVPVGMLLQFIDTDSLNQGDSTRSEATGRRSSSGSAKSKRESKQARAAVVTG
jgi:DNA-binding Xre family transcriptional regulator